MSVATAPPPPSRPPQRTGNRWSRLNRGGQIVGSFIAVLAAYFFYWLLAVPLIEPELESMAIEPATREQLAAAAIAWVRGSATGQVFSRGLVGTGQASNHRERPDLAAVQNVRAVGGKLEVKPCTVMFFQTGRGLKLPTRSCRSSCTRKKAQKLSRRADRPQERRLSQAKAGERQFTGRHPH